MDMKTLGVIGAGTMGGGIAQVMAASGYDVVLNDINAAAVERGLTAVDQSLEKLESREKSAASGTLRPCW